MGTPFFPLRGPPRSSISIFFTEVRLVFSAHPYKETEGLEQAIAWAIEEES